MEFSLYGKYGGNLMERVATFKYLGIPVDQTYDDWPVFHWNIMHTMSFWGKLGTLLIKKERTPR